MGVMRDEKEKEYRVQGFGTGFTFQVFFFFLHSDRERKSRERERDRETQREICGSEKQVGEGNSFSHTLSREMGSHEWMNWRLHKNSHWLQPAGIYVYHAILSYQGRFQPFKDSLHILWTINGGTIREFRWKYINKKKLFQKLKI
jgi:hypothetical protein